jgi:hypothetical protein
MGDQATLPPGAASAAFSVEQTTALFRIYREGGVTPCPRCTVHVALSIDSANSYRFVCTGCGASSPWFQAGPEGITPRWPAAPGTASTVVPDGESS